MIESLAIPVDLMGGLKHETLRWCGLRFSNYGPCQAFAGYVCFYTRVGPGYASARPGLRLECPALPLDDFITGNVLQRWLIDVDVKST